MAWKTGFGRCLRGVSRENLKCRARDSNWLRYQFALGLYGAIPPSLNERRGSGITRPGSNSSVMPRPEHSGHAPRGLLKENRRGCSSGMLIPQFGQALFWEKRISRSVSFSRTSAMSVPPEVSSAPSTDSESRLRASGAIVSLSTTISMECFFLRSREIVSSRGRISPSTRTRT